MMTGREKLSVGLMFFGVALGAAAGTAALPKTHLSERTVVYHDDAGALHPVDEQRGFISPTTAAWLGLGAVASLLAGFNLRDR